MHEFLTFCVGQWLRAASRPIQALARRRVWESSPIICIIVSPCVCDPAPACFHSIAKVCPTVHDPAGSGHHHPLLCPAKRRNPAASFGNWTRVFEAKQSYCAPKGKHPSILALPALSLQSCHVRTHKFPNGQNPENEAEEITHPVVEQNKVSVLVLCGCPRTYMPTQPQSTAWFSPHEDEKP